METLRFEHWGPVDGCGNTGPNHRFLVLLCDGMLSFAPLASHGEEKSTWPAPVLTGVPLRQVVGESNLAGRGLRKPANPHRAQVA